MADLSPATAAVLQASSSLPAESTTVRGPTDLTSVSKVLEAMESVGYQATQFHRAVELVNAALDQKKNGLLFFLGVSANVAATGVRESITFLFKHRMIDAVVLSGGAAEYDLARALGVRNNLCDSTRSGAAGKKMEGVDVVGNIGIQTALMEQTCSEFLKSHVLPSMQASQKKKRAQCVAEGHRDNEPCYTDWATTPADFWNAVGLTLPQCVNEDALAGSFLYWAAKNEIPLFSPNFSDGLIAELLADMPEAEGLRFDLVRDIGSLNRTALKAAMTAMIVAGGGVVKHHVCNANLMRNGADFAVFLNNAQEYDGSDAGARPDEAVSWGKIKIDGKSSKVYGEVSITFPLLIQQTFLPFLAREDPTQ